MRLKHNNQHYIACYVSIYFSVLPENIFRVTNLVEPDVPTSFQSNSQDFGGKFPTPLKATYALV